MSQEIGCPYRNGCPAYNRKSQFESRGGAEGGLMAQNFTDSCDRGTPTYLETACPLFGQTLELKKLKELSSKVLGQIEAVTEASARMNEITTKAIKESGMSSEDLLP